MRRQPYQFDRLHRELGPGIGQGLSVETVCWRQSETAPLVGLRRAERAPSIVVERDVFLSDELLQRLLRGGP